MTSPRLTWTRFQTSSSSDTSQSRYVYCGSRAYAATPLTVPGTCGFASWLSSKWRLPTPSSRGEVAPRLGTLETEKT